MVHFHHSKEKYNTMANYYRLLLLLFLSCRSQHAFSSRVSIPNNGYRDIVVAISPNLPPDEDLLKKIELLITEASAVLYEATRHRSYIESVNILIPQTWENVTANVSIWENFENAEIQIDLPNWKHGYRPYTVQLGGCGEPGQHIHLTPNYLMNFDSDSYKIDFGPAGKVFVREWARLRYGVFEEHGYPDDDSEFPLFYRSMFGESGDLMPNVCSDQPVDFTYNYGCRVDKSYLYNKNCSYSFTDQFKPGSSMMSDYRMLQTAMHFCDDEESSLHKHNREAPNKHNAVCNAESIWSVITRHADFAGDNNLPVNITNLNPKFNIVRVLDGARYVLVTDVSGSMIANNRIGKLYDSARRWIQDEIPNGTSLGIVKFHSYATVLSNVTIVNDATRQELMDKVPNRVEDSTCIGCGLQKAIEILSSGGNGGIIVLLTDGGENIYPFIRNVTPGLMAAQIQVVSIAFGRDAENEIENLATKTLGRSYFVNEFGNNDELTNAFTGSLIYQPTFSSDNKNVQLFQKKYPIGARSKRSLPIFQDSVIVDWSVGRNLTFRIDYTNKTHLQGFSAYSPKGQSYSALTYHDPAKMAYIEIPEVADEGEWNFTLTVSSSFKDYVSVIVKSKSRSSSLAPITVECSVPSGTVVVDAAISPVRLVAVVQQGRNRVIGAHVQAYVERPDGSLQVIDLWDSGVGSDSEKNDGIYSRYYGNVVDVGRYTLRCVVSGSQSTYIEDGNGQEQRTIIGNFNRIQSGGTFRVVMPVTSNASYPPNRVTDLKVVAMQVNQTSMTIEWTAPGQELDVGIAKEYQIKYSDAFDNLIGNNFTNMAMQFGQQDVINGSLQPLESGSKQRVTLVLPNASKNVTFYIALRAINDKNATSNTSNVVSAKIAVIQQPPTESPISTLQTTIALLAINDKNATSNTSNVVSAKIDVIHQPPTESPISTLQTTTDLLAINDKTATSNTSNVVSAKIDVIQQPPTEPPISTLQTTTSINNHTSTSSNAFTYILSQSTATTWSPETTTKAGSKRVLASSSNLLICLLSALLISKVHSTISSWFN